MSSFHWLSSLNKSYPATPHNGPPALRPRTFDEHAERAFCAVCGAGVYLWWFEDEDDELEAGEMSAARANATAKAKARAKGKTRVCAQTADDADAGSRGHRLWVAAGAIADAAEPDAVTSSSVGGVADAADAATAKVRVNITVRHHIWLGEKAAWDVLPADGAEKWVADVGGEAWKAECVA